MAKGVRRSSARQSRRESFEADTRLFAVSISDEEDEGSRYRRRHETQPSHGRLLPLSAEQPLQPVPSRVSAPAPCLMIA